MKKYNAPEIKVLSINVQSMIAQSSEYVPGIDPNPQEMVKDNDFEDIESSLFGGE